MRQTDAIGEAVVGGTAVGDFAGGEGLDRLEEVRKVAVIVGEPSGKVRRQIVGSSLGQVPVEFAAESRDKGCQRIGSRERCSRFGFAEELRE